MAQLDDYVGAVLEHLEDRGLADNTIVVFTTDNGAENFTWPDGGQTPVRRRQGHGARRRLPRTVHPPLAWQGAGRKVENGIISGLDWFPTFVAAAGNPNIVEELLAGKDVGGTNYKVHLDGYDQLDFSPARRRRSATSSSTSPRPRSARCASATTNTGSPISPTAGSATP